MLSKKEIEELSKFIVEGDDPKAIVDLIQLKLQKQIEKVYPAETVPLHKSDIWKLFSPSEKSVVCVDANGKILDINTAFTKTFKLTKEEIARQNILTVLQAQEELLLQGDSERSEEARFGEFHIRCIKADGKQMFVRVDRFSIEGDNQIYLLLTDITEQKRYEETITQDSVRCEIFIDIVDALWQDFMNYEKTLDVLTNKITQHIGGSCIIHKFMENSDIIEHVAINHHNPKATSVFQELLYSTRWHASNGLPNEVVLGGNAILVPNVTRENISILGNELFGECISVLGTKSLLMLPMYLNESIIGTMTLLRTGTDQPYTNRDKSFTQRIANIGAMAMLNAQRMKRINSELVTKLNKARNDYCKTKLLEATTNSVALLLKNDPTEKQLESVLSYLGMALGAETAFLAERCKAGSFRPIEIWANNDVEPILPEVFEGDIQLCPNWQTQLEAGIGVVRMREDFIEEEEALCKNTSLLSIAMLPVLYLGRLIGVSVFENCHEHLECFEKNSDALKTVMRLVASRITGT